MKRRVCCGCDTLKNCPSLIDGRAACCRCYNVHRWPEEQCTFCLRTRRLYGLRDEGRPICGVCKNKRHPKLGTCSSCGKEGALKTNLCSECYQTAHTTVGPCAKCGKERRLVFSTKCTVCKNLATHQRLREERVMTLLGSEDALSLPQVAPLVERLCRSKHATNMIAWIGTLAAEIIDYLGAVGQGTPITYDGLRPLLELPGGRRLLSFCLDAGLIDRTALARAELGELVEACIAKLPVETGQILQQYWRFVLEPNLADRPANFVRTDRTFANDRQRVYCLTDFFIYAGGLRCKFSDISQVEVNKYLSQRPSYYSTWLRALVKWLVESRMVKRPVRTAKTRSSHCEAPPQEYLELLNRARTDEKLPLVVRVGLLFVLVTLRGPRAFIELKKTKVIRRGSDRVEIAFRDGLPWPIEGPDALLILALRSQCESWLFTSPSHLGCPMSAKGFASKLRAAGIVCNITHLVMAGIRQFVSLHGAGELARARGFTRNAAGQWARRFGHFSTDDKRRLAKVGRKSHGSRIGLAGTPAQL